jgi:glycosyltransferase involved in cell wall biosynthesis
MAGRLLQIVSSLEVSEATATVATVSRWAVGEGMDVEVLGLQGPGGLAAALQADGVPVRWIEPPVRHIAQWVYRVRRELQRFRPDLVHTWTEQANAIGRLATVTTGVPRLIASVRTLPDRPSLWNHALERTLARRTQTYVVNSRTAYQFCQAQGVPGARLTLIPDGVSVAAPATEAERMDVRQRLGLPPQAKLIGAVGPLLPAKRLKDLIWATDLLRVFYRDIRLLVIGDGPQRWRLQRYARQVQAPWRTLFLGERDDWRDLIRGLDCLGQAGQRESQPRAVLEAMAVGVPVVATNIAGHRELIEPDQTGRLVPVGDRGAMARQIYRLLEDRPLAERLTSAARQFVQQQHSVDTMLQRYRQLYLEGAAGTADANRLSGGIRPSIP